MLRNVNGLRPGTIPARAGSTHGESAPPTGTWDHPRSRGEHPSEINPRTAASGPSPLARGAQGWYEVSTRGGGTIPARAGSTSRRPERKGTGRDHPRSRGEHDLHPPQHQTPEGPSPLARGALQHLAVNEPGGRTIPARAGSTRCRSAPVRPGWDHPRSRGEHLSGGEAIMRPEGPSPLARGAQARLSGIEAGVGTIPARAGSTSSLPVTSRHQRDHPRSRGEHEGELTGIQSSEGPSPLARGALAARVLVARPLRTIPARAGSTPPR